MKNYYGTYLFAGATFSWFCMSTAPVYDLRLAQQLPNPEDLPMPEDPTKHWSLVQNFLWILIDTPRYPFFQLTWPCVSELKRAA